MGLRCVYAVCVLMSIGLDAHPGPDTDRGLDYVARGDEWLETENTIIRIPFGVHEVGAKMFRGRKQITGVELVDSIETIHSAAFADCVRLRDVVVPPSVMKIGSYAFMNCCSITSLVIKAAIPALQKSTCGRCWRLENVELPESLVEICDSCFEGDISLRRIALPSSVKTIGRRAFAGCSRLNEVTLPAEMEVIEEYAFANCCDMRCVVLPRNVKRLCKGIFEGCHALEGVVVTGSLPIAADDLLRGSSDFVKIYLVKIDGEASAEYSDVRNLMHAYDVVKCRDVDEARKLIYDGLSNRESAHTKELKNILYLALEGFTSQLPDGTVDLPGLSELAANVQEFCTLTNDVSLEKWYARHPIRVTADRDRDGKCSTVTSNFGRYDGMPVSFGITMQDGHCILSEGLKKGISIGKELKCGEIKDDFSGMWQ